MSLFVKGEEPQTHVMVQCMWGSDNESAFPILGCYANWTFWGLPSTSGLAFPPLVCDTSSLLVYNMCMCTME